MHFSLAQWIPGQSTQTQKGGGEHDIYKTDSLFKDKMNYKQERSGRHFPLLPSGTDTFDANSTLF